MNEAIYTLDIGLTTVVIYDGRLKGSRLKYYADGLKIYVTGAITVKKRDIVMYHAFDIACAHHIPLRSLKSEGWI